MEKIKQDMIILGFSEKEVEVYLTILQVDCEKVGAISHKSGVNRATVYTVLQKLLYKGLILEKNINGELHYQAESPLVICALLDLEMKNLTEKQMIAQRVASKLKMFYRESREQPRIRYMENLEGIQLMQKSFEEMEGEIIQIVGLDTFHELYSTSVNDEHCKRLSQKRKKIRAIIISDQNIRFDDLNIEYIVIPPSILSVKGEMSVCDNKLVLFSYTKSLIAIEITSKSIAGTARATLELAWKEAKRIEDNLKV